MSPFDSLCFLQGVSFLEAPCTLQKGQGKDVKSSFGICLGLQRPSQAPAAGCVSPPLSTGQRGIISVRPRAPNASQRAVNSKAFMQTSMPSSLSAVFELLARSVCLLFAGSCSGPGPAASWAVRAGHRGESFSEHLAGRGVSRAVLDTWGNGFLPSRGTLGGEGMVPGHMAACPFVTWCSRFTVELKGTACLSSPL